MLKRIVRPLFSAIIRLLTGVLATRGAPALFGGKRDRVGLMAANRAVATCVLGLSPDALSE